MIRFDYEATGSEGRLVLLGPLVAEDAAELGRVIRQCAETTPRLALRVEDAKCIDEACLRVIESALETGSLRPLQGRRSEQSPLKQRDRR